MASHYDPRKAIWNDVKIDDWEPGDWKKWKPHATGSPTDFPVVAEREYLRIKYAIQLANKQLDADKVRVKLKLTNPRSIGLQGSFPCRHGDIGKNGSPVKQYTISLGFAANDAGVKTAVTRARELDLQLMTKVFRWTPELLGKQAQKLELPEDDHKSAKLISELIQEYEIQFWKTHERNRQGIANWANSYILYLKKLPQDTVLSNKALSEALEKTQPGTVARRKLVWQLNKFCEFCGFDGSKTIKSYTTGQPERKRRNIPNDAEILEAFSKIGEPITHGLHTKAIQPEQWQWIYGMLATFGLRPHELFAIDLEAFADPTNIHHLVTLRPELTKGTKTGERNCGIPPLHPDWVNLFDLKAIKLPSSNADVYSYSKIIGRKFRTANIGFKPYDLRHAFALRGHRLQIPIKAMADFMGHTPAEHTTTYQKWMSKDTNLEIYKEVVLEKGLSTKEAMKVMLAKLETENISLRAENAALKAEVEALRLQMTEYQLNGLINS